MTLLKPKLFLYCMAGIAGMLLNGTPCYSQLHAPDIPANSKLVLAEEQYHQQHYALAAQSAKQFLRGQHSNVPTRSKAEEDKANYFLMLACLQLNTAGSADSANVFVHSASNPVYKQRVAYLLAQHYFERSQLARAIPYYEMAGISNLSNKELIEEKFELAYCYFNNKQFDKAEPLFASIKELQEGKYYSAGNYYYGLLVYNENNYKDALQSFDRIKDEPQYKSIVPYYIAEIYYFMGNRQKALDEALMLIRRPEKLYYDNELHLLAAQCLFEEQKYGDALPYFESYYDHTERIRKEDLYEMAYCYYRVEEWPHAIDKFKLLSNTRDSLGQTAMYLLGDCYLKTGDKQSARSAFGICADMPYNPGQQEASMLLDGKLSYEMGYNDDAIRQLTNLLTTYPNSAYRDEAKTLLSGLLIKTSNYAAALDQLHDVANKTGDYWAVHQKVTFGYAMQEFQKGDYATADSFLTLSLSNAVDPYYEAATYFWKGDLAYRMHQYNDVLSYSNSFLEKKANEQSVRYLSPMATPQHAYLNMGYAAMAMNNYSTAQGYFAHAQEIKGTDSTIGMVAVTREADAVFMQKDYKRAAALYDKVIAVNGPDADYARFQKSILLGLQGKLADKAVILQGLINKTPASLYANSARYELAQTYIQEDKYQQAIALLQPLTTSADSRNFASKAWIKMGFAYQQMDNDDKAIDAYKHVITDYPTSEDRQAALDALKSLYIDNNQPGAYAQMLKDNKIPAADSTGLDSTYYSAAEAQFAAGKWNEAVQAMTRYLQQYPNGAFVVKAHYYRAESNYQLKDYKAALTDYSAVLTGPWNEFSENSSRKAAFIAYQDKDYAAATNYYGELRNSAMGQESLAVAYDGLMKSSYNKDDYKGATSYADTLLSLPGINQATTDDAVFYKAKAMQQGDNADSALNLYKQLGSSKNGEIAAESRYRIAAIYLQQNKLKEAEAQANETIHLSDGHDYWVVKSYILLADILTSEKDYFNAKATLQSIVQHTKIAELKQEATKKLEAVKALERQHSKLQED